MSSGTPRWRSPFRSRARLNQAFVGEVGLGWVWIACWLGWTPQWSKVTFKRLSKLSIGETCIQYPQTKAKQNLPDFSLHSPNSQNILSSTMSQIWSPAVIFFYTHNLSHDKISSNPTLKHLKRKLKKKSWAVYDFSQNLGNLSPGINIRSTLSSVMIAIRIVPPELPSRDIAKANAAWYPYIKSCEVDQALKYKKNSRLTIFDKFNSLFFGPTFTIGWITITVNIRRSTSSDCPRLLEKSSTQWD